MRRTTGLPRVPVGSGATLIQAAAERKERMGKPVPAQFGPYRLAAKAGRTYYWCVCGRSKKQPLCDGSHRDTGLEPLAWKCDREGEVWLCGCKSTADRPFCDGTHTKLRAERS